MAKDKNIAVYDAYGVFSGRDSKGSLASALARGEAPHTYNPSLSSPVAQLRESDNEALRELRRETRILKGGDRVCAISLLSAKQVVEKNREFLRDTQCSVTVGSSRGPTGLLESSHSTFVENKKVPTTTSPLTTMGNLSSTLAQALEINASFTSTVSSTCTSGISALINSYSMIQSGLVEAAISVGAEAPVTPFTEAQMRALGILAKGDPQSFPSQPLAKARDPKSGLTLGEGGAAFLLSTLNKTTPETPPMGIISGIGSASEKITSLTGMSEDGELLFHSMKRALADAGNPPIDLVLMHAPGTAKGDSAEIKAVTSCFPSDTPPLYSPKWLLGHTFGASGALSLLLAIELINGAVLNPLPYESYGGEKLPLRSTPRNILINTAGFGGVAASIVISSPSS